MEWLIHKLKKNIWVWVGLFTVIISHKVWFFNYSVLTNADWGFHFVSTLRELRSWPLAWDSGSFGSLMLTSSFFPMNWMAGSLATFNLGFAIIERLLYLWPTSIIAFLSSYFLIKRIFTLDIAAFIGSIVYSCNVYFLLLQTQHLTIALAYALVPYVLLYFFKSFETHKTSIAVMAALILFALSVFEFRIYYIILPILLLYFAYDLYSKKRNVNEILEHFRILILVILPSALLNIYWLLPIYLTGSLTGNSILSRSLFGAQYLDLLDAFALFHKFWSGGYVEWFLIHPLPIYFWMIPFLAFLGFYFNTENRKVLYFSLVSLLGILLTKQTDLPWPNFYPWLFSHIPGFNAFREASKFYVLIALGYSILIAAFINALWQGKYRISAYLRYFIVLFVALLFIWNLKPLVSGDFKTLFVPRSIPNDYVIFEKFILDQPNFSRTLWIPQTSRWGIATNNHPEISEADVIQSNWVDFIQQDKQMFRDPIQGQLINILKEPYSQQFLDFSSIKYVVLPLQDEANDDDFYLYYGGSNDRNIRVWYKNELDSIPYLKEIDINTKDLIVYENTSYKSYISSLDKVYGFNSLDNLNDKYNFISNILHDNFDFTLRTSTAVAFTKFYNPFENIDPNHIVGTTIIAQRTSLTDGEVLYINTAETDVYARIKNKEFELYSQDDNNIWQNDQELGLPSLSRVIYQKELSPQSQYYIGLNSNLIPVKSLESTRFLGKASAVSDIQIYSSLGANKIPNGSFQNGLWQPQVGDCNNYDDSGQLEQNLQSSSIELGAITHIACTGEESLLVKSRANYVFSFDYQSANASQAGFYLKFNDASGTVLTEKLPITSGDWQSFTSNVEVPDGASKFSIAVYSYSEGGGINIVTNYRNFAFYELEDVTDVKINYLPSFALQKGRLNSRDDLKFIEPNYFLQNIIPNPSFENGLWKSVVGDCNNYDDNGMLGMILDSTDKTDGQSSLNLQATRHTACTGPGLLNVDGGGSYLFNFDYQLPNGGSAGYYLRFNNFGGSNVSEQLQSSDTKWHNFNKVIQVPSGATTMSLTVYSYEGNGIKKMIARYDNFGFRELPDLSNQFYLVSTGTPLFTNPQSISFNLISPTKKTVHIHGATTPFYLSMSEAYHDQWQAEFDNSKVNAGLAKWSPFAKPDLIPASDHFKLDDFLNGWYIDTPSLCGASSTTGNGTALCTKNPDGSYDMNLVIEFWPQRYFYLGLIISGATLAGCVGYLIYAYWPGRGKKKVIKLNVVKTPANSEPILKPKVKDIIHPTEPPLPPPTE